jgi:hypothetical protein
MSSSIRPPGAPPPGPTGLDGVSDLKPGQTDAVASSQAAGQTGAAAATESPTGAWLRRLSAGEVSKEQAVEALVAQAVEAHGGARLSAAQRAELSDVLRDALLGDPVLGELLGG